PYILVYKRENPDAYMAFGAKNFEPRSPRASELRNGLSDALDKIVDMDTRKEYAEEMDQNWMGQPGVGFKFKGLLKGGGAAEGEAIAISYKGIGYWFLAWTGENDIYLDQRSAFADGRRKCKLLDLRENWTQQQSSTAAYKNNVVGYTILDPDGMWKEVTDEDDLRQEGADKMLTIALGNRKNLQKHGTLLVYVTDSGGDPLPTARQMVMDKRASEVKLANPDFSAEFTDRTEPPADQPANTVQQTSEVTRFQSKVKNAANQTRLHVVSAA